MAIEITKIRELLSFVNHPETGKDLISLGLVHDIKIDGNKVEITLLFKRVNDPFTNSIKKAIEKTIKDSFGNDCEVLIYANHNKKPQNPEYDSLKEIKNIIAISSGKGGVGKSTVSTNLAVSLAMQGYKVGLLDADCYGPSIPTMFGSQNMQPQATRIEKKDFIIPLERFGVKIQSIGFYVKPDNALVWRGPMATNALKQLITQTLWGELDYLLIDLPPGTGDIHLTLVQEIALTGALVVSTPQQVALLDVMKGIAMFQSEKINVPVLGIIENMSWFTPKEMPENKYFLFGKKGCQELSEKLSLPILAKIPLFEGLSEDSDEGTPGALEVESPVGIAYKELAQSIVSIIKERNELLPPTQRVIIQTK